VEITHGALIDRAVLTRVDPQDPLKPGAVMAYVKRFSRAVLEAGVATTPTSHSDEQEIFYVADGRGRVRVGDQMQEVREGFGVLIPPGLEHTLFNDGDEPLEVLTLTEDAPASARGQTRTTALMRDYHDQPVGMGHWSHVVRALFGREDGLVALHSVLVVSIDGMRIAEPHPHGPGTDEVWYALKGDSLLFLGKELRRQCEGVAFMIPPDGQTPHASINDGDKPMQWFYFAHYGP